MERDGSSTHSQTVWTEDVHFSEQLINILGFAVMVFSCSCWTLQLLADVPAVNGVL